MPPPSDMPYYLAPLLWCSPSPHKPHSTVMLLDLKNDAASREGRSNLKRCKSLESCGLQPPPEGRKMGKLGRRYGCTHFERLFCQLDTKLVCFRGLVGFIVNGWIMEIRGSFIRIRLSVFSCLCQLWPKQLHGPWRAFLIKKILAASREAFFIGLRRSVGPEGRLFSSYKRNERH